MKVILLEDDDVKEVKDGYARNYLLPRKLAVPASAANLAKMEKRREKMASEIAQYEAQAKELAEKLSASEIIILADAGEKDKLFGSIGSKEIAEAVKAQAGLEIDRKKIVLTEPIKLLGEYKIPVKLFHKTQAQINIIVKKK